MRPHSCCSRCSPHAQFGECRSNSQVTKLAFIGVLQAGLMLCHSNGISRFGPCADYSIPSALTTYPQLLHGFMPFQVTTR